MSDLSPVLGNAQAIRDPLWNPPCMDGSVARSRPRGIVSLALRSAMLLYLMFLIVDGALPQLEILLTRGHAPIPMTVYLLLPLSLLVVLVRARVQHNPLLFATLALAGYILVDWIVLAAITPYSLNEIRLSLEVYLFAVVVLGLCVSSPVAVPAQYVVRVLMVLFLASCCVSALQFLSGEAVVATRSMDNNFQIPSYRFGGQIRAFSLFSSGLHAGLFYCLTAGFGASLCFTRGRKTLGSVVLAMSAFGCYATLTRLTILGLAATLATVTLIRSTKARVLIPWVPVLWLLLAVAVVGKAVHDSGQASGLGISNTSSMEARLVEWRFYSQRYLAGGAAQMMMGQGMSQWMDVTAPARPATAAPISVDNAYLDLLLNSGLFGLALVIFFCWNLWAVLYKKALATGSNLVIASAAVFSVLPFFSAINGFLPEIFIIGLLPLLCRIDGGDAPQQLSAATTKGPQPEILNGW